MGHTPGPWKRNIKPATKYNVVWSGRNRHVAKVEVEILPEEEIEANINLIVAAPDLLAVCERAKKLLEPELTREPHRTIFWELVTAIAKAKGERT